MFRPKIEIRVFENRMRVTSLETGKAIERAADIPFSSARMLVADTDSARNLLNAICMDLEGRRRWLAWPTAIFRPMELCPDGLSAVEKAAIVKMLEGLGFAKVEFAA